MTDVWTLAAILSKTVLYFGVLTGAGLVLVQHVFASLVKDVLLAMRRFTLVCATLGAAAALASFAFRGAALTGDASGITDPTILGIMWQTSVGSALVLRLVGLGAIILGLLVGDHGRMLTLAGAGVALWSFSTIGHAADSSVFWTEFVLFLHLVAVSFWVGILFPLGKLARDPLTVMTAGKLGHRFGQIALGVIPLLVLAGVLISWKLVGSWFALFTTSYGIMLLGKLTGVAGLLMLGALNKFQFVPKLAAGDASADTTFRKVLNAEWLFFALVFLGTAMLTTLFSVPTT